MLIVTSLTSLPWGRKIKEVITRLLTSHFQNYSVKIHFKATQSSRFFVSNVNLRTEKQNKIQTIYGDSSVQNNYNLGTQSKYQMCSSVFRIRYEIILKIGVVTAICPRAGNVYIKRDFGVKETQRETIEQYSQSNNILEDREKSLHFSTSFFFYSTLFLNL